MKTYHGHPQDARDKDIDAVSIATPNHWHALAAIWAMQAGKDVYVEKPVSHNVWEGRQLVEAAASTTTASCQAGTQSRSSRRHARGHRVHPRRQARQGAPSPAACATSAAPASARSTAPQPVAGDDRLRPLVRPGADGAASQRARRLHYDWHWIWDYGNGDLGNQGIHQMDIARWGLGKSELSPRSCISVGGRFGYIDDGETPNTQIVRLRLRRRELIFEVRGLTSRKENKKWTNTAAPASASSRIRKRLRRRPDYKNAAVFDHAEQAPGVVDSELAGACHQGTDVLGQAPTAESEPGFEERRPIRGSSRSRRRAGHVGAGRLA